MEQQMARKWLILGIVIALTLGVDQLTKRLVLAELDFGETAQPIPALVPLFQITLSYNTGAAFGFLPQAGDIFLVIAVIVIIAMIIFYPRLPDSARITRYGIGLVSGGALGNAVDRLDHGAVVDFIHYTIPGVISNVSNLADHAIVFGVLLILIESWRTEEPKPAATAADAPEEPNSP